MPEGPPESFNLRPAVLPSRSTPHPAAPRPPAGFEPLSPTWGPYLALLLVAVLVQEVARLGVVRFHG